MDLLEVWTQLFLTVHCSNTLFIIHISTEVIRRIYTEVCSYFRKCTKYGKQPKLYPFHINVLQKSVSNLDNVQIKGLV